MATQKRMAITGGASGYGKALALHFASEGWNVGFMDIHLERGNETLAELKAKYPRIEAFFLQGDVRKTECFEQFRDEVLERWGGLDMLINNAGVASYATLEEAPLEDWQWVIEINLLSIVRSSQVFIPLFKKQRGGQIVNVASMAGLLFGPKMGSYNATKAGVVALSETMLFELKPFGVGVSVVCPGFFQTNLGESVKTSDPKTKDTIARLLASSKLSASEIAAFTYKKIMNRSFMILTHPLYKRFWLIKRYAPALYYHLMDKRTAGTR